MIDLLVSTVRDRPRPLSRIFSLAFCQSAVPVLSLLLLAMSASSVVSQQFATLNLTLADPSGSVIAQANVSVRNVDTGVVRTGVSDQLGLTVIPGLPAAEYKLTAGAKGFAAYEAPESLRVRSPAALETESPVRRIRRLELRPLPAPQGRPSFR